MGHSDDPRTRRTHTGERHCWAADRFGTCVLRGDRLASMVASEVREPNRPSPGSAVDLANLGDLACAIPVSRNPAYRRRASDKARTEHSFWYRGNGPDTRLAMVAY